MAGLIFAISCVAAAFVLAMNRAPILIWAVAAAVAALVFGFAVAGGGMTLWSVLLAWLPAAILGAMSIPTLKRRFIVEPLFKSIKSSFPTVSETEKAALEAGTVGWDAELFSGDPDFSRLRSIAPITLTDEERAFLDGPTEELCEMLDDWEIRHERHHIPPKAWKFVADNGFLGMLISKEHGGLGFSAQAQSLILGKIGSRSPDAVTIVMVPNSLGPGELVEKYGTPEQKEHYLPRLAQGKEIPCFALTGPTSGSDAATMRDVGFVCEQEFEGKKTLGIKLTFDKRYITLAPKATVVGLAFILFDPDGLLGDSEDRGITLALLPADHDGVNIGRRHLPSGAAFPNGPVWGTDVFIPLDWVIGGRDGVGEGWRMLMESLSAGRSISLPASSTAAAKAMLRFTTAYANIRRQFGLAIGHMEGIEEPLARMVENAYVIEAGRAVTAAMVAAGEKPAVISALLKYQSTEKMRQSVSDAMDIHGGRAICDGPSNYIQGAYQMVPVGITVEGANILTRTLITFAQGALRSHPWLYKEIEAVQDSDEARGLEAFDRAFGGHVAYSVANAFGAFFHNATGGLFARAPNSAGYATPWYRELHRGARTFAIVADVTVGLLGGGMKTKQKITGRLADALSELYWLSCILKRFEDDGMPIEDLKIVEFAAQNGLFRFQQAIRGVIDNFPIRPAAWVLRAIAFPLGTRKRPASDRLGKQIVRLALKPGEVRDRLTRDIYISHDPDDPTGILEHTLLRTVELREVQRNVARAVSKGIIRRYHGHDWIGEAVEKNVISKEEAGKLRELEELTAKAIAVDHFDPAEVFPNFEKAPGAKEKVKAVSSADRTAGAKSRSGVSKEAAE